MPDVVTFDGPNRIITEIDAGGDNVLDVIEIYSEWKDWVRTSDNAKFEQAFSVVGGDPISATQNLGSTFFLENGWRIRPAERNHKLTLVGNLFTREEGESPTVAVLGAFTVSVELRVSNLVDSSVSRLDLAQLQEYVFVDTINGTAGTTEGLGTPTNPVDNLTDAIIIAARDNLRGFSIVGDVLLKSDFSQFVFRGTVGRNGGSVDLGGRDVDLCKFTNIEITGEGTGQIEAVACKITDVDGLEGEFRECGIAGLVTPGANTLTSLIDCFSQIPGKAVPSIDLVLGASDSLQVRGYNGGVRLLNMDNSDEFVSFDFTAGRLVIDASCTAGELVVRGVGEVLDERLPGNTLALKLDGFIEATDVRTARKLLQNRTVTNPLTGEMQVFNDDDNQVEFSGNLFEDAAGTQPYRGQGAERRDRLG
jgi:hypothetical protein